MFISCSQRVVKILLKGSNCDSYCEISNISITLQMPKSRGDSGNQSVNNDGESLKTFKV